MKPKTDEEFAAWVAKQPVWVFRKIEVLRNQIKNLQDTLAERSADHSGDSNILVDPHSVSPYWLPKYARVRYFMSEDRMDGYDRFDIRVRRESWSEGSFLEIVAGNGLRIQPRASNSVRVWTNNDW
jgi:hypothetical protein